MVAKIVNQHSQNCHDVVNLRITQKEVKGA